MRTAHASGTNARAIRGALTAGPRSPQLGHLAHPTSFAVAMSSSCARSWGQPRELAWQETPASLADRATLLSSRVRRAEGVVRTVYASGETRDVFGWSFAEHASISSCDT